MEAEASNVEPVDRIVRERECRQLTGLGPTRRWQLEREGQFPRRVKLSTHAVGWRLSELQDWIRSRQTA